MQFARLIRQHCKLHSLLIGKSQLSSLYNNHYLQKNLIELSYRGSSDLNQKLLKIIAPLFVKLKVKIPDILRLKSKFYLTFKKK